MTREDLFLAIGQVENSRLTRSERTTGSHPRFEGEDAAKKTRKNIRKKMMTLLAAVLILTTLAVTACAVGAYVIYDSPADMLKAIFGNDTGYDHGVYTEIPDPWRPGSILAAQPAYERVEADPAVVDEDIVPHVSPVGQSIAYHDMILRVDAFLYDSATQCGIVTYTLENGPAYELQFNGIISYPGMPDPVRFSHYGYSYLIQEKTSEEVLAAAYYFRYEPDRGDFHAALRDGMTAAERKQMYEDAAAEIAASYTPEEMVAKVKDQLGEEIFQEITQERKPEEAALEYLRDELIMQWMKDYQDTSEEKIVFDCAESGELEHITLAGGSVTISPVSMVVDIADLDFLHTDPHGNHRIHTDNIHSITLVYADGTEFAVRDGETDNTVFGLVSTADGTMETEYSILTHMFNRVIDIEKVQSVIINGKELDRD